MKSFVQFINESPAEDIFKKVKAHEPFKTILSDTDEKAFITKAKKTLKTYGIKDWMVDHVVTDFKKANAGKTRVFISAEAIIQGLIKSGDIKHS